MTEGGVSEGVGFAMLAAYGLWLIVVPNALLRVVDTMNGGKVRLPSPGVVRLFGALWLIVVLLMWSASR
ncbi:hypothetical protein QH494_17850 [Sphingomonas sp. AR_OL41]|uniref:hypothetical protein n=1 Tax=Sphingomonas sp. AR_OL41 TaxID=3042729 RepID=UPI002480B2C0|nr:hypothetical protein [Sphingomonas sp. AR_OL41]MDH7974056.1 hypothetical protein [Sphingomonas sp. AR_OL41]